MSYNFELALSTMVTSSVAEEMIKHVIEQQTGKKIARIDCRYNDSKFDGFDVVFASETYSKTPTTNKVDKKFKPIEWDS